MASSRTTMKSCQSCRSAKTKCISSPDPNVQDCQRCIKYNKECFYEEARPRPKRGRQAHTRVAEVEKKLHDIYQSLQSGKQENSPDLSEVPTSGPERSHPEADLGPRSPGDSMMLRHGEPGPMSIAKDPRQAHKHRDRDAIDKEILTETEATKLLQFYHQISQAFPFVYISPKKSLDMLRHEKPFLLLSILTISSQRTRSLQILLEKELRGVLAAKVIIEGELSLDVLQGLLLYLAWYHHNFRPCRQQINQLTQLCGAMAIDLELHKPPDIDPGFVVHPSKNCMAKKINAAAPFQNDVEAMRTFLGVYCLTTSISIMLRKPNGMTWSPFLERCCNEIAKASEAPMDPYLLYYTQLTHICEDINSTFGYCNPEPDLQLSPQRIQGTIRAFVARVQAIAKSIPSEVNNIPSIASLLYFTSNLAYEIILHLDARTSSSSTTGSSNTTDPWLSSSVRTDMFLSCLDSTISCLDWYKNQPASTFERFNLLDLSRISYHLLLLGRLTLSGVPGSEADTAAQAEKLDGYFAAFIKKYQELAVLQGVDERKSVYWHMHETFLASREWLSNSIAERAATGEPIDPATAARMKPNFQVVSPSGIVDLDKGNIETLGPSFHVAASTGETRRHRHSTHERSMRSVNTWQAAMLALPAAGIGGSLLL